MCIVTVSAGVWGIRCLYNIEGRSFKRIYFTLKFKNVKELTSRDYKWNKSTEHKKSRQHFPNTLDKYLWNKTVCIVYLKNKLVIYYTITSHNTLIITFNTRKTVEICYSVINNSYKELNVSLVRYVKS